MRENLFILALCVCFVVLLNGCWDGNRNKNTKQVYDYETMYKDSFAVLIGSLESSDYTPTIADTLYTEMYIGLKTLESDEKSAQIVLDRVSELMKIDTIKENQIHYLDAKAIVLSYQKKYDEYWNNAYEQYNLYPENSHERLESLGVWFKNRGNNDSAVYYFDKCIEVYQNKLSEAQNRQDREDAIFAILRSYMLQDKDNEARLFATSVKTLDLDKDTKDMLDYASNNYSAFKSEVYSSALK